MTHATRSMHRAALTGLVLMLVAVTGARAAVTIDEEVTDGKTRYRLSNGRITFVVDPAVGGSIVSFRDKLGGDVELVPARWPSGLCMDHFQTQPWPGEMLQATYQPTVEKRSPDECVLRMSYTVNGEWKGVQHEKIAGLRLDKRYVLRSTTPAMECRVRITSPGNASKLFAYWQQNIFQAGGQHDRLTDRSFRPTRRGVRAKQGANNGHTKHESWIRDFTDGWMALIDTQRKTGLVVLSSYDELDVAYMCLGNFTLEPMYRMTYLPPSDSAEYVNVYVPVVGLDNVVAASRDYVAGYAMRTNGTGDGEVTFQVVRSVDAPKAIKFSVNMASVGALDKVKKVGEVTVPAPTVKPVSRTLRFTGVGADPLVMRVDVAGAAAHHFEEYFNGTYKWGENIQIDMATPVYIGARPPQKFVLKKPAKLKLKRVYSTQVWYVEGLMDNYYRCAEAVKITGNWSSKGQTRRDQSFVSYSSGFKTRLDSFPYDYEKLLTYDFIILGGVKREAIGGVGLEMLADYCKARGPVLVLGGPNAYGASGLAGSDFTRYWPVEFTGGPFQMARLDDAPIELGPGAKDVPFLESIDFSARPRVQYMHKVKVKPWGKVVLKAGGMPFLVVSDRDGHRMACILGAPIGTPAKGHVAFWQWDQWIYLLQQTNWWLQRYGNDLRFRRDPDLICWD